MRPEIRIDCAGEEQQEFIRPKVMSQCVVELKARPLELDLW
jgi:hypothetical protein